MIDAATDALRRCSPAVLKTGLLRLLHDGELQWLQDRRDLLVAMAPYYDCARRLELDPAAFFGSVADQGPLALADIVRSFGERADVTPSAFGYRLVMTPAGATYEWDQSDAPRRSRAGAPPGVLRNFAKGGTSS